MVLLGSERSINNLQSITLITEGKYEVRPLRSLKEFVSEQFILRGTLREKLQITFEAGMPPTATVLGPHAISKATNGRRRQMV